MIGKLIAAVYLPSELKARARGKPHGRISNKLLQNKDDNKQVNTNVTNIIQFTCKVSKSAKTRVIYIPRKYHEQIDRLGEINVSITKPEKKSLEI
jgi:hypothetical protein